MRRGALEGDMETGMMIGGQGIGRIGAVLPAAEIVAPDRRRGRAGAGACGALPRWTSAFTDEQRMLRKSRADFVERKVPKAFARELEGREEYPAELAKRIAKAGLNGIGIPEELGGEGGDIIDQVIVMEELSRSLAGLGWLWGINVWSGGKAIVSHGSHEQQAELLPRIADGPAEFAFAMTEPGGGTDVLRAMKTRATAGRRRLADQRQQDLVDARARRRPRARPRPHAPTHDKPITRADDVHRRRAPTGFDARRRSRSSGCARSAPARSSFDDVFVPDADVLGEVERGWQHVTATLNSERIMVAAMCTGILARRARGRDRLRQGAHAFGKPIGADAGRPAPDRRHRDGRSRPAACTPTAPPGWSARAGRAASRRRWRSA